MKYSLTKMSVIVVATTIISACGGDDDDDGPASTPPPTAMPTPIAANVGLSTSVLNEAHRFDNPASQIKMNVVASSSMSGALDYAITITNLTNAQPMSPVLAVLHGSQYRAFNDGDMASLAIESMAEGGDTTALITTAMTAPDYLGHASSDGAIGPKSSQQLNFTVANNDRDDLHITILSMLVNTNDAFTGLNAADISQLSAGSNMSFYGVVWDAGSEANTESAGTMPGPADGGEGFNAARSDNLNKVRLHSGVVTNALSGGLIEN